MNIYYFIAQKISKARKRSFSSIVTRIAVASISIGLAVILIAFGILVGFRKAIQDKLFSFSGHMHITQVSLNNSYQETPISTNTDLYKNFKKIPSIAHLHSFAQKAGILKTEEEVLGVVLKGIGEDYDAQRFTHNLIEGEFLKFTKKTNPNDILISKKIADKLKLNLHDTIVMFFVQNPPRFRKLFICGIFETGMDEFDDKIIIGNLSLVRKLNNWADTLAGGYEVFVKDFSQLDSIAVPEVLEAMNYDMRLEPVTQRYMDVFDWLSLLNKNVSIFLTLILIVASFNMISILLIMIMERVQMIGILKALGASDFQIQRIFIYTGMLLIAKGLFFGNLIGLGFCALQYYFKIIPLDPENYYMNTVPIDWDWGIIVLMNILTFVLVSVVLILPTIIIARIKPIKAIRFD